MPTDFLVSCPRDQRVIILEIEGRVSRNAPMPCDENIIIVIIES